MEAGESGRARFIQRASFPRELRPAIDGKTVREQIVLRGAVTILVAEEGLPGQYEVCRKKTIGWFAGEILLPERPASAFQI